MWVFHETHPYIQDPIFSYRNALNVILQVWDSSIIETAEETFYNSEVDELISALDKNITVSNLILPYQSPTISFNDMYSCWHS